MTEQKTIKWRDDQFYRVNGIPMAYESLTVHGLNYDYIMDYEGGTWTADQLEAKGYTVQKPKQKRLNICK